MLPLKKIYIDSRDRTVDSKSASNFKIELPNTVQMPENTVFFVTDVCVPHVTHYGAFLRSVSTTLSWFYPAVCILTAAQQPAQAKATEETQHMNLQVKYYITSKIYFNTIF